MEQHPTVYTHSNLPNNFTELPFGSEISEEVYMDMLNVLPPISLHNSPYCGFQMGEPYDYARTPDGRMRARYLTFAHIGQHYFYMGVQFGAFCPPLASPTAK